MVVSYHLREDMSLPLQEQLIKEMPLWQFLQGRATWTDYLLGHIVILDMVRRFPLKQKDFWFGVGTFEMHLILSRLLS